MTATQAIEHVEEVRQEITEMEAAVAAAVEAAVEAAKAEKPAVPDPWGIGGNPIEIGRTFTRQEWTKIQNMDQCRQRCAGAPGLYAYGYCQRELGHGPELNHFVANVDTRAVTWVWANGTEKLVEQVVAAEPDAVEDPPDAKVEQFTQHLRVNYRNKRDILLVLSVPKKRDTHVEVLDLTHQKFRKPRKEMLVPARDDDPEPTQEQMAWVAEFIADRRRNAFEIAAREVTNRRWGKDEMLASVAKIGISPPPVQHGVTVSMSVDFRLPGRNLNGVDQAELQAAFEAAVKVAAAKTMPDGFSVRRVHNFNVGGVEEIR